MNNKELFKSFGIVFFGSFAASVLNYFFHVVTGRFLGPVEYGELVALVSLVTILVVPLGAIGINFTKEIAKLKGLGKEKEINFLLWKYTKLFFIIGIICFIILVAISPFLADFLHVDIISIWLICFTLVFVGSATILSSALNGLQKFGKSVAQGFVGALFKLLFAIGAVLIGYGLFGSAFAFSFGTIIAFLMCAYFLRKRLSGEKKVSSFSIKTDLVFVIVALVLFNLLNNLDVILAKHFLLEADAGLYGAASELGKIIFFLTGTLAIVLIPKAAEQKAKNLDHHKFLLKTIAVVTAISLIGLAGYFLFPTIVVPLLYGNEYISISGLIFFTGLSSALFSISSMLVNYFISVDRKKFIMFLFVGAILETLLIMLFHATILDIVIDVLVATTLLTAGLLVYSFFDAKQDLKGKKGKNS